MRGAEMQREQNPAGRRILRNLNMNKTHNKPSAQRSESRILHARAAFTLVELLVVITIIGILAALITVAAVGALKKARQTQIKTELNEISSGFDEYKNKTTAYPPNCQNDAAGPLDEAGILNDVRRHMKQIAQRSQESDDLTKLLVGQKGTLEPAKYARELPGGMTAGEAVVFWLGGFSSDAKYPISGEGGPSYDVTGVSAPDRGKADPIESRKWVYPFEVSRLGPRNSDGYFDDSKGRYLEYTDPKGTLRRINFWQYLPSHSEQPYLYFDTSRHPAGVLATSTKLVGNYDPPAATAASGLGLNVYAFKKVSESAATNTPQIQYINPAKFQVIHCGLTNAWDETNFLRMAPGANGTNVPGDYLLFPTGPFIGDIADTIVNFVTETKIEDAQK
jgi:prepilin-type N-terminal cleavage/methylation domain-containing protein